MGITNPSKAHHRPVFLTLLFAGLFSALPLQAAKEIRIDASSRKTTPFLQLAEQITGAGDGQRRDFAWIAVSEVAAAYQEVLDRSTEQMPDTLKKERKLYRWRAGTRRFIEELHFMLSQLGSAREVHIQVPPTGTVIVFADEKPIAISGPEIGAARLMENRIIDSYCGVHDCSFLNQEPTKETPRATPKPKVPPGSWSFDQYGNISFHTEDGIEFLFSSSGDRRRKQRICNSLAAELRILADGLRKTRRAGHSIVWEKLQVEPLAGSSKSRVLLNGAGEYLSLPLPYLEQSTVLREGGLAWIRAQIMGKPIAVSFLRSDRFARLITPQADGGQGK
jgi:hypothetical protein